MKLKDYINTKLAQEISDEETMDLIFEDLRMDVEALFPREREDEIYMKLIDRLKLFVGVE